MEFVVLVLISEFNFLAYNAMCLLQTSTDYGIFSGIKRLLSRVRKNKVTSSKGDDSIKNVIPVPHIPLWRPFVLVRGFGLELLIYNPSTVFSSDQEPPVFLTWQLLPIKSLHRRYDHYLYDGKSMPAYAGSKGKSISPF
jgi:hypothetical protein